MVHYTAGFGPGLFLAFGATGVTDIRLPASSSVAALARVFLDVAGGAFGFYLLLFLVLVAWPRRRTGPRPPAEARP